MKAKLMVYVFMGNIVRTKEIDPYGLIGGLK
jgi:hypothetical protein